MRKVALAVAAAGFMMGCGVNNDSSSAKVVATEDSGETYTVYISEFDNLDGFKTQGARNKAMAQLLNLTIAANEEAKSMYSDILKKGLVEGRKLTTDTECRRIMEDEFGEDGLTVYTFGFNVESGSYIDNDDLTDEGIELHYDGSMFRRMAIKVLYDVNPVKNGKVSMEGVKILKVKFIAQDSTPC